MPLRRQPLPPHPRAPQAEDRLSERVVVGIVRRTRGVRGELVVESLSDLPGRFEQLEKLYLVTPSGERPVTIQSVRAQAGAEVWVCLEEVHDREMAMGLRGATLEIEATERPAPPEGEYYYDQLEGLEVVDPKGNHIGTLSRVLPRGGQDLYAVETDSGEVLVPAAAAIVKQVDLESGRVVIDPPKGLLGDGHED
jgi:16S rRNA processing protein RimM